MLSDARRREFASVRSAIRSWAEIDHDVLGVALVGSWARGEAGTDSDIDVVVVTESDRFVRGDDWIVDARDPWYDPDDRIGHLISTVAGRRP